MPDALKRYKAKRDFGVTPEPADGGEPGGEVLSFVIQKHWASRLHYDFRLELDGTMKSWAIPKGPSFDSSDKRMAVQVEDHPLAYSSFEGTIPPKQYGAGKVIIWDKGSWHPLHEPHQAYADGNLKFELRGHKMHGKWVLVRMHHKDKSTARSDEKKEAWLLIKEKDEFTRPAAEFSVVDEMPDSVQALPPPGAPPKGAPPAPIDGGTKATLPATLAPQLATLVDAPPSSGADWLFEIKYDGYRLLARIAGSDIKLLTRNGNDWTHRLEALAQALLKMKLPPGWYDGEIVVMEADGRPDFGALQRAFDGENTADIVYYLFDLPFFDGADLRQLPLEARRQLLQAALGKAASPSVRFSAQFDASMHDLMAAACQMGLEGIIGKRRDSVYVSRRSPDWIKLKCGLRQEFVIGGYTDPQGKRAGLGALLLGTYGKDGALNYAGKVGTGFDQSTLRELKVRLDELAATDSPFATATGTGAKSHWVRPVLVAEVSFGAWTRAGAIRHAAFQGLRLDKAAESITREVPGKVEPAMDKTDQAVPARLPATLKVSNPERVIDAESGATKIELLRYYGLVGALMLVHLKGRPVSLLRAPSGVGGELFFQKHADIAKMAGMKQLAQDLDPEHAPMLEVASVAGLLSAAQWNVIEFHTQNALASTYLMPNRIVFDLDPGKGVAWSAIQEAALLLRAFLEQLGLVPFLKTSGGKGLHVVVPIRPACDWDTVKDFSQAVVAHLATTIPQRFVLKSGPRNRVGKIFIDYLRNGRGATTASAWSARARPGLGISVPVAWDELASLKGGAHWTVRNVHTRLDQGNAPWKAYTGSAKSLATAMKRLGFKAESSD